jgi:hypothetical protein
MATRRTSKRRNQIKKKRAGKSRWGLRPRFEQLESRLYLSAQPFIGGDIVVYRVGDGSISLTNGGNPIFLDEYSPSGTLVQSVEMPFSSNPDDLQGGVHSPTANPNPINNAGSATPSGEITLSADGRYLSFTGYDVSLPSGANGTNLKARTDIARDVGRVDINGSVDTSTAPTDYAVSGSSGFTPAGALSIDGSGFYVYSQQVDSLRYANLGATSSTPLTSPADATAHHFSNLQIYNGQLYGIDVSGGFFQIGTGAPTSGTNALTPVAGVTGLGSKSDAFFFATVNAAAHAANPTAPDILYIADPGTTYTVASTTYTGEIRKFTADTYDGSGNPTHWTDRGFVMVDPVNNKGQITGLTGYSTGTSVLMYATSGASNANAGQYGGALFSFTDRLANDGADGTLPATATATTLVPFFNAYNQGFRGIALVPNQAPTLSGSNSNLPAIFENPVSNPGQLVSAVLSGLGGSAVTDTVGSRQGIAITAADSSNGTWQFSLNGGTTWQGFPAVSNTSALTLASNSSTRIRFVPNANYSGSATITFKAWDQSQGVSGQTFDIAHVVAPAGTSPFSTATATATQTVTFVNQAPSFVRGASQSILNTAGAQTISNWATNINKGGANESGQTLNFIVSNNNNPLFTVQPSIDPATGTLTYTPAPGANGVANVTVQLHDNGGTVNGGHDTSAVQMFQIAVTPVGGNQPPINTIPFAGQTTLENQSITFSTGNGNAISVSDPDAAGNTIQVSLTVVGGTATLSTLSGLSGSGSGTSSLTYTGTIASLNAALNGVVYTPTSNLSGVAAGQITIATNDLGNTGSGGAKTSTDAITINITPVNQAPSFTSGANVTVPASASYNQPWATSISAGPANESGQSVHFIVSNNNPTAFTVQPSISPTGVLTFTPVAGPASTTTVTVQLQDDGGTDNGGTDTSAVKTFLIQLTAVDLAPVNTVPGTQRLIKNTPLLFSSGLYNPANVNEYNAISVSDPDGFTSLEQVKLTATHGTITYVVNPSAPVTVVAGANNSSTVTIKGTLTNLNTALDGLIFTPTSGFTGTGVGGATITLDTNDLSAVAGGPITTSSTFHIDVVDPPALEISELLDNPPGAPDHPNEYIEIRSATPNYTIPSGTYLVSVSGQPISVVQGISVVNYPTGTVVDTFDLGGRKTGSDGYLVILENGNTFNNYPDFGGLGLVDPRATVLDNGINPDGSPAIGTGAGFGNNFVAPGSSIVGHSSLFRPNDVDVYKGSTTFMLIQSPGSVTPGDSLDSPLNVTPTGTLHGTEFSSWNVLDAVGATISTQSLNGDVSYGFINYVDNSSPGFTNYATPNSTIIPGSFTADYFGRANNNSGWVATDWVGTSGINGDTPTYGLGGKSNTVPSSDGKRPLNNLGGPNFDLSQPAVLTTTPGTLNYPVGSGPMVLDSNVTVTDPDSFFLGSAQISIGTGVPGDYNADGTVNAADYTLWRDHLGQTYQLQNEAAGQTPGQVTVEDYNYWKAHFGATSAVGGGYNPATDSLAFAGTQFISGSFDATTGILTLSGYDTMDNWNAALQSVTFNYSGSVVTNPTRTITFKADDGLVLSNRPTRTINIQGPVASPPIVTGTSGTPVAWTEALPPASAPVVTIAPGLTITDGSTGQLTSATVTISQNFSSGEDVLGWNATVAAANNITVSSSPHSHFITLTPTTPDTSESLAAFQAVLRTVNYTNTSQKPTAVPRTITFTVVDSNSITSTVTTSSQQLVSVTAVNNPPLITTSGGTDSYVLNAPAVLIDGSLTLTDPDNASLVGATVKITGGFASGDTLAFNNQGGIAGTYVPATGVLTLTGSATPLEYQIALRAVTFSTSAAAGLRTISFQADDNATPGTPDGNVATKLISVSASGAGSGAAAFFADLGSSPSSVANVSLNVAVAPASSDNSNAKELLLAQFLSTASVPSFVSAPAIATDSVSDNSSSATAGEEREVALLAVLDEGLDPVWA